MLRKRKLGRQGLEVSEIGLGCMGMSQSYGEGTKRRRYLEENVGAAAIPLSPTEMGTLEAALAPEKVAGPRYNRERMATIDR